MNKNQLPIRWKITILSYIVVIFSLIIGGILLVGEIQQTEEKELEKRTMMIARTVSELPEVKDALSLDERNDIKHVVEEIRVINEMDYIVVMDMNHTRLTHPIDRLIGKVSEGGDEAAAFAESIYFSKAMGETGLALRAFYPVKNDNLEQIGVVMVGKTLPGIVNILSDLKAEIIFIVVSTLIFGLIGSIFLANHMKNQMFQLEPYEIARILEERTATFHAINEGVIAIDNKERISIFNNKAKRIFNVKGEPVGKQIREVLADTRLPEIIERNKVVYNEEIQVSGRVILSNRIPIEIKKQVIGAVAIFQDRTEAAKLAEELTGVKSFIEALRVQNHEHLNKLHTIAGLIQLGKPEKALDLAFHAFEETESQTKFLNEIVKNDAVAGLILSKIKRGNELGITVSIDPNSRLHQFPKNLDQHDFVVLFGNLLENAFGALEIADRENKKIDISLEAHADLLAILIEDNGCGIANEDLPHLYEKGFTKNKRNGTGYGLHLVKQIVDKGNGEINVSSEQGKGTAFTITFPIEQEEYDGVYDSSFADRR
jgi:two-component system sensor histidine kinase DctS